MLSQLPTCHEGRHLLALRCLPEAKLDTPLLVSSLEKLMMIRVVFHLSYLSDWSESDGEERPGAVLARESLKVFMVIVLISDSHSFQTAVFTQILENSRMAKSF